MVSFILFVIVVGSILLPRKIEVERELTNRAQDVLDKSILDELHTNMSLEKHIPHLDHLKKSLI
jgi:hypothetical protein